MKLLFHINVVFSKYPPDTESASVEPGDITKNFHGGKKHTSSKSENKKTNDAPEDDEKDSTTINNEGSVALLNMLGHDLENKLKTKLTSSDGEKAEPTVSKVAKHETEGQTEKTAAKKGNGINYRVFLL